MKDTLTGEELLGILSGKKKTVKVDSIWDFKSSYGINGCIALVHRIGRMRYALPHLIATEVESDEFKAALKIIKQIQKEKEVVRGKKKI